MLKTSIGFLAVAAFTGATVAPEGTLSTMHAHIANHVHHAHAYIHEHMAGLQQRRAPSGVAGTWNLTLMSHQVAMVLEQSGKAITGTLMIMGKDVPLEGEFADATLTIIGKGALAAGPAEHGGSAEGSKPVPIKLTAKLLEDGTLEGEMDTAKGPVKWTAERLRTRK